MASTTLYALQEMLHLAGTAALLATLDARLLLLPFFAIGSLLADRRAWQRYLAALDAAAELRRRKMHFFGLATSPEAGKELRVFDLGTEMVARHGADGAEQLRIQTRPLWNGLILQALAAALLAAGYGGASALVLARALQGQVTPGDVLLAITLAAQMQDLVGELVSSGNSWLRIVREASRYFWLADYAKRVDDKPLAEKPVPSTLGRGIELQNVSFSYPGTKTPVLQNISLQLEAGRVVALVGENGAGKTTLAKLLSRFYEPTAGRITVDGVEVNQFDVEAWRSRLSAGFQDYSQFEFLMRETVGVGDVAQIENPQAVHDALAKADAHDIPPTLPRGLETQLGRVWDGGVELSGGQWQKLALGRAFMRTDPLLVILDEPTAALDAQTEHGVFERIAGRISPWPVSGNRDPTDLAPILDRPNGRPHHRSPSRARCGTRKSRRSDARGRTLRRAVRAAGPSLSVAGGLSIRAPIRWSRTCRGRRFASRWCLRFGRRLDRLLVVKLGVALPRRVLTPPRFAVKRE